MTIFLSLIIQLLTGVIEFILAPIDNMVSSYLPNLSTGLDYISDFFDYINGYIQFVMGWVGLPSFALNIISAWVIFILVIRPIVYGVKIIIKWVKTLKS